MSPWFCKNCSRVDNEHFPVFVQSVAVLALATCICCVYTTTPRVQSVAVLALAKLMMVSSEFCDENINLLFTILGKPLNRIPILDMVLMPNIALNSYCKLYCFILVRVILCHVLSTPQISRIVRRLVVTSWCRYMTSS